MKDSAMFMRAMATTDGPVFEIMCDPKGGCGKSSLHKHNNGVKE